MFVDGLIMSYADVTEHSSSHTVRGPPSGIIPWPPMFRLICPGAVLALMFVDGLIMSYADVTEHSSSHTVLLVLLHLFGYAVLVPSLQVRASFYELAFTRYLYFRVVVHESIVLLFLKPACIAHTVAILLHDYWAI